MFQPMDVNLGAQPLAGMPTPQMPQMPGMAQRHGMFGAGGVGRNIAGMIGDLLMARAGMQPMYAPMMMQQRKLAYEAQLQAQQRQQEFQDQRKAHQQDRDYDINNPLPQQPDQTERLLARYLDPTTPAQEKDAIGQILMPPTLQMVNGSLVSVPRTPQQMPTAPVGKLTPYNPGGPSPSGSGGFPYQ